MDPASSSAAVRRTFPFADHSPRKAEISHLHGDAEPIVISSMLANESRVLPVQRVQANQLSSISAEGEPFQALYRRQQLAARHSMPTLPDALYFLLETKVAGVAMVNTFEPRTLRFTPQ